MDHYSPAHQASSSLNLAVSSNIMMNHQIDHDGDQRMLNLTPQQATRYMNQRDKVLMYQLNQYYMAKATARSKNIVKTIQEVVKIVQDVLRELEIQEPRFISTFTEVNGHYEGKRLIIYRPLFVNKCRLN